MEVGVQFEGERSFDVVLGLEVHLCIYAQLLISQKEK